jgi:hypothetical protein
MTGLPSQDSTFTEMSASVVLLGLSAREVLILTSILRVRRERLIQEFSRREMVAMGPLVDPVGVAEDRVTGLLRSANRLMDSSLEELGFDPSVEREFDFDRTRDSDSD